MRTATIILSALLAIAIGSEIITYSKYANKKDAFLERENMLSAAKKNGELMKEQMSDLRDQISELTAQVDAGKMEKVALKAQTAAAGVLREKLIKASETTARLKQKILDLEGRTKALTAELDAEKRKKATLDRKASVADDLRKKLVMANEDVDKLKLRISDLEGRQKTLIEQVAAEKKEKEFLKTQAAVADDLQEELDEANEEADRMKLRIFALESQMKRLTAQVAEEKREKAVFKARTVAAAVFKEKLHKLGKELDGSRENNENLSRELEACDTTLAELRQRILQMEGELALKEKRNEELEEKFEKELDQIKGMHDQVVNLTDEKKKRKAEMQQLKSTYASLISDLKKQIDSQEVSINIFKKKISVLFVDRILFDFGKASISLQGRAILKKVGKILKRVNNKRIRVVGHTDNVGIQKRYRFRFPSNWELSAARAAAVVRYFQKEAGVKPGMLEAVGRSFYEPIAANDTRKGRAQNRRVNIVIAPNL